MHRYFCCLLALTVTLPAFAQETVGVEGSAVRFPTRVTLPVAGKPVALNLTGTALRTKLIFKVYAMGSFLQEDIKATTADEVAQAKAAKMFYLVMEREVSVRDFTDAIKSAIGGSQDASQFNGDFAQISTALGNKPLRKGDHIMLLAAPNGELKVSIINRVDLTIKNAAFTQAVWNAYLGTQPVHAGIKAGLVSRLGK
ncbi:MAG: chalcone isomerase family protein [Bacteroidales bacterium]|nr:chalcone isomerase family protein [Bacteroidales bacterium]